MADPKVDRQALVDGLNEDLASEYQAVIMYNTYSAMATGIHRPILKQFFEAEIPEELRHAAYLADKIAALGGTPTTRAAEFKPAASLVQMLRQVLDAESSSIGRYVARRKQAEALEDYGLAVDLDTIISDETKHKEETEKLMRHLEE